MHRRRMFALHLLLTAQLLPGLVHAAVTIPATKPATKPAHGQHLEVTRHPQTLLKSWHYRHAGFRLELTQRLPDQNRAIMQARGFSETVADLIAKQCLFKTVIQNQTEADRNIRIHIDLRKWRIRHGNRFYRMKTREYWTGVFLPKHKHKPASALALKWGLYPTTNTLQAGDYNWGLSSFGLAPGARFDLKIVWTRNDKPRTLWINGMQCPPDVDRLKKAER